MTYFFMIVTKIATFCDKSKYLSQKVAIYVTKMDYMSKI